MTEKVFLNIEQIQKRIPHRFPFLLVDRVLSFSYGPDQNSPVGRKIVALKNVTMNEQYFQGHFPEQAVMPGVLQIEAMAQAGAIACAPGDDDSVDVLFAKINHARFRKPVVPGDRLELHAEITNARKSLYTVDCKAYCDGAVVSEVELVASVTPRKGN
ncbi:MAG: 3-hydroxyacyl-ACP dehydratase FabZ [Bdellovibrionales bacterium]|nr:3-hydroxyacyl-ACP dehydratase FabZ [Bdellovibrionales bacterium]